jgi:hypothetical protein
MPSTLLRLACLTIMVVISLVSLVLEGPKAVEPEGKTPRRIRAIGAVQPQLAPDGKDVVFSYQGSIWRVAAAGGTMKRLAAPAGFATEPCWSPDGKQIAFLHGSGWGSGNLHLVAADTGKSIHRFDTVLGAGKLSFSPDGKRLYGTLRKGEQVPALRTLDLETGSLATVVRWPTMILHPWAVSSDGKWAVYVTTRDEVGKKQTGDAGAANEIWKVPTSGGEPQRLATFPARIYDLCWSANDRALFVCTDLGGAHNDIWRIDLDNVERPVKLTFGQADEERPSISRDGRWLLYTDNREGCPGLVLYDLGSGDVHTLSVDKLDFGTPTGRIRLTVRDKVSGKATVARVSLRKKDGGFHAPPGALWHVNRDYAHFGVKDSVEFELPEGTYDLRAWHGPEFRRLEATVELTAGRTAEHALNFERWADPNAEHWYSGDNHIHANYGEYGYGYGGYYNSPETMADLCAGEGLNVCNFMVANSAGDGVFDREHFRGRPDTHSTPQTVLYWNEEFRSTIWGHMTLVNLQQVVEPVFTGFKETTNPYDIPTMRAIAERTHRQGGLVNYTHPAQRLDDPYDSPYAAKGLPVYAALGVIDSMDIMNWFDDASTAVYHRLLNCGFRIAGSAGTDCFLNHISCYLPGTERVYVQTGGPLTYPKWIDGLRAGRSFASNMPMVALTVNGKALGAVVELEEAGEVRVQASAHCQHPLAKLDAFYNGKVVATGVLAVDRRSATVDRKIKVDRSGWIAVRATGPGVRDDVKNAQLYAHTSPVYVTVAGKPAGSVEDAKYFLRWIDRLWDDVRARARIPGAKAEKEVEDEIEKASAVYRKILERESAREPE